MKKSKIVLALMSVVIVLSLAVVQPLAIDPPDFSNIYTQHVDLSTLTVLTGVPSLQDENQWFVSDLRTVFGLGTVDFSNYSEITISYASAANALFGEDGSYWALLRSAEFTDYSDEENVIAKGSLSNAQGAWFEDIRSSTIDVSGIDYVGEAFLAFYLPHSTLKFMSMDITYQVYTQAQVNELLSQYIQAGNGIYTDCKVYAAVNYTLSIADVDGGAYKDYNRTWYYDAPYEVLAGGISFKPWYQRMKNELFGSLTNADEGYINTITLYVHLKDPTNIYSLDLYSNTTSLYGVNSAVTFLTTENLARDVVYETQGAYTHYLLKSFPGLSDNINVTEIQFQLTKSAGADFDALFLTNDFSVFTDSLLFEKYAEAYNNGLSAGKEIQLREQVVEVNKAYNSAYDKGLKEGNHAGYQQASREKDAEYNQIINDLNTSHQEQEAARYEAGVTEGQRIGFINGYNQGITENSSNVTGQMNNLFFGLFDSISSFILGFLNFNILGVNLFQLACAVFTIMFFVFWLKLVLPLIGKL